MDKTRIIAFMVLLIISLVVAGFEAVDVMDKAREEAANLKKEAVERGYAQYNPTTGNWGWKETHEIKD